MIKSVTQSGKQAFGVRPIANSFSLSFIQIDTNIGSPPPEQMTTSEEIWSKRFSARFNRNWQVNQSGIFDSTPQFFSSNDSIATVNRDTGFMSRVADGTCNLITKTRKQSKTSSRSFTHFGGVQNGLDWVGYTSDNSVPKHALNQLEALATDDAADKTMFSVRDHTNQIYTKNPNFWLKDVIGSFSGVSVYNNLDSDWRGGTVLTPSLIVSAQHFHLVTGNLVRFIGTDGSVNDRTITGSLDLSVNDFTIHTLNSPLPETVHPVKNLPDNWQDYMPGLAANIDTIGDRIITGDYGSAAIFINQFREVYPYRWVDIQELGCAYQIIQNTQSLLYPIRGQVVDKDSGLPVFAIINNEPILIGLCLSYELSTIVQSIITDLEFQINYFSNLMGVENPGLQKADFSMFHNYNA